MDANISIKASLNDIANQFVVSLEDASAEGTYIDFKIPTKNASAPYYSDPFQVTFTGLTQKAYILKLWESPDGTVSGTVRNSTNFQPTSTTTTIRADLVIQADVTPGFASGGTTYTDTSLVGWTYSVERKGTGTMVEYSTPDITDPEYQQDGIGGWHLLRSGDQISNQEVFIHRFQPQVAAAVPASPTIISSGVVLDTTIALDNTYVNKALYIQGTGLIVPITLPNLATITDYQMLIFYSSGGNHISAPITAYGTDKILFNGQQTKITLNQCEQLKLFKANGVWNVDYASPGILRVGELILNYSKVEKNTLLLDGTQNLSRTTYARLWDFISSLESGCIVTAANWGATSIVNSITYYINKGKFNTGDGSTTFGLPLIHNYGFLKAVDGSTRFPGNLETGQVGAFSDNISLTLGNSFSGSPGGGWPGYPGKGQDNPQAKTFGQTFNATKENLVTNIGVYALIRI